MQSREELAVRLLNLTKLDELKAKTRHEREWGRVYRGFRADHLTRQEFLNGAHEFARQLPLLESLCDAFLDSLGVEQDAKLATRLAKAGEMESPVTDAEAAALLQELQSTSLADLPVRSPDTETPSEAGVTGAERSPE